jgi:hypothetical protein
MNFLKLIFAKKMFLVLLIILAIYVINLPSGINKTISWGWLEELGFLIKLYFVFILFFYTACYTIIALLKKQTSINISILHTLTLVLSVFTINTISDDIILSINIVSFIFFSINIIHSFNFNKIK